MMIFKMIDERAHTPILEIIVVELLRDWHPFEIVKSRETLRHLFPPLSS